MGAVYGYADLFIVVGLYAESRLLSVYVLVCLEADYECLHLNSPSQ